MAKTRRWNLNEVTGRHAGTNLTESVMDLHLGVKRADGAKVPVGRFRLDLEDLSKQGFVTQRGTGAARVFDVQIYREGNGTFLLGVRRGQTTRLDRFRVG